MIKAMFPTFYLLLVLVVFPSEHINSWDNTSLNDQTNTMTFPMASEAACNEAAAMVRATVQVVGQISGRRNGHHALSQRSGSPGHFVTASRAGASADRVRREPLAAVKSGWISIMSSGRNRTLPHPEEQPIGSGLRPARR